MFLPQTAKKSSLHGFDVNDNTVNGIGADDNLVKVSFLLEVSACLSNADN